MNEEEWLTTTNAPAMLGFLGQRKTTRKLRLFACACCRCHWERLLDKRSRRAVEMSEKYADRAVALNELESARANARGAMRHVQDAAWSEATYLAELTTREDVGDAVARIV